MKAWQILLLLCGIGLVVYGLSGPATPVVTGEELVAREVNSKLASWQQRRDQDCRRRALDLALEVADSMLLDYAREQKLMLARPSRPERPVEPELLRPSDTLQLRPFLTDTLVRDSATATRMDSM